MAISKQDLCGARTAADIERKYNFDKSFSEVMGFAEKAQRSAEEAQAAVTTLNENLSQEEIFNRLTNNGEAEGIFRDDNGQIFINAEYINFDELNGKDITMTGVFVCETECYVPPAREEVETIEAHLRGDVIIPDGLIPLYDFDSDGQVTQNDLDTAQMMSSGFTPPDGWPAARKTLVTMRIDMSDPERAIQFGGTNVWGREFYGYIGASFTTAKCPETEARIAALEARIKALENA